MPTLHWFRRDLRVEDNRALAAALTNGPVVPVFVVDPSLAAAATRRRSLLASMLAHLDAALGQTLVVRVGRPEQVLVELADAFGADEVYATADHTPYARRRDTAVAAALATTGRHLVELPGNYAVEPGTCIRGDGGPYSVFTPFLRSWSARVDRAALTGAPRDPTWVERTGDRAELGLVHLASPVDDIDTVVEVAGRWRRFVAGPLGRYGTDRDLPALDGTSRMSSALRFGLVHPTRLLADLDLADEHHRRFAAQLAWRDFHADLLRRVPSATWRPLDERFDRFACDTDSVALTRFERWKTGTTGFELVDAGMRQLLATGWMHNRVRMVTASFLVKDLHLPWQWGARWFLSQLVDGDLASNNLSFQWVAGCGADAAPFHRVFNPVLQAERFDPDGSYRDRWIPERGSTGYPSPMVDHAAERLVALERYAAVRR